MAVIYQANMVATDAIANLSDWDYAICEPNESIWIVPGTHVAESWGVAWIWDND